MKQDKRSYTDNYRFDKVALVISIINAICNILLFLIKYILGIIGKSNSLMADAFHSLSDLLISLIIIIGIFVSRKKANKKLPFGYDRFENILSIVLSFILLNMSYIICSKSISSLVSRTYLSYLLPNIFAIVAEIISIVIKLTMFFVTLKIANKTNFSILKADAWHHFSDMFSSVGVLVGVLGTMLGIRFCDEVASIFISVIILKVGVDIFVDATKKLIGYSSSEDVINKINNIINNYSDFELILLQSVRFSGSNIIIVELLFHKLSYHEAKQKSEIIKANINKNINNIKSIYIILTPQS